MYQIFGNFQKARVFIGPHMPVTRRRTPVFEGGPNPGGGYYLWDLEYSELLKAKHKYTELKTLIPYW